MQESLYFIGIILKRKIKNARRINLNILELKNGIVLLIKFKRLQRVKTTKLFLNLH